MAATKSTTARKAPADRKPPKSEQIAAAEQPPAGYDLLKPVQNLRSAEQVEIQADLLELFEGLGIDFDAAQEAKEKGEEFKAEVDNNADTLRAVGRMGAVLEKYVVAGRELDYVALDTGAGATTRVMDLGMWYLSALGESDGSAS